jgi:phosphoenolpyruvate-protein kinase (PTS system EI component)
MRLELALSGESPKNGSRLSHEAIGLVRGEYVFRKARSYITTHAGEEALASYVTALVTEFSNCPIWYRLSELDAEEVKVLAGADGTYINDRILGMGTRGVRRAMLLPEAFRREVSVVAQQSQKHAAFGIIIPFLADVAELDWALAEIRLAGFSGPVGIMAEIPAAVVTLDVLLERDLGRVLVGINDLTQFVMAAYRGSSRYPGLPAGVRRMIEIARETTNRHGCELAMAGALTEDHLTAAREIGVDGCAVHYSDWPRLFGAQFNDLPELGQLAEIKKWTRAAIHERRRIAGQIPVDPYGN